jgi:sigma-B regulation protein RsbU (phosphoserine phosphatase)
MLLNRTIHGMFITAIVGRVFLPERRVDFANAGHCHPFLIRATGEVEELPIPGSPPIGILPKLIGSQSSLILADGEILVLCTDGLTDSQGPEKQPLDRCGVIGLLNRRYESPSDVVDALNTGELNHRRDAEPHDDLTVLAFGLRGART